MNIGAQIHVRGLVQGVGYRYFINRNAAKYGLCGYVKNLPNGNVDIFVEGDRSLIEEFIKDAKCGPMVSRVTDLQIEWKTFENKYTDFRIY